MFYGSIIWMVGLYPIGNLCEYTFNNQRRDKKMAFLTRTLDKLKSGLAKSRQKINNSLKTVLTLGRRIDENLLDELEEQLISDDIGVETSLQIIEDLRTAWKEKKISLTDLT